MGVEAGAETAGAGLASGVGRGVAGAETGAVDGGCVAGTDTGGSVVGAKTGPCVADVDVATGTAGEFTGAAVVPAFGVSVGTVPANIFASTFSALTSPSFPPTFIFSPSTGVVVGVPGSSPTPISFAANTAAALCLFFLGALSSIDTKFPTCFPCPSLNS